MARRKDTISDDGGPQRAYRCPDSIYNAAMARAREHGIVLSDVIRAALIAFANDPAPPPQGALFAPDPRPPAPAGESRKRALGEWERRARAIVRGLDLPPDAAGYGDLLRQAGRDRDFSESTTSVPARVAAQKQWERALSLLTAAPANRETSSADPWESLADDLRAAAVRHET
jgi:hypothetical protein